MGPKPTNRRSSRESGQAAVESALVLPISVFLILGSLQLFMMHQARVMAEYAAFRATRAGSVNHGNCEAMNHAALAALLPTFRSVRDPAELGEQFKAVRDNRFGDGYMLSTSEDIANEDVVWIYRERPLRSAVPSDEDREFDARFNEPMQLQVTMIYWYPMRIPFADWVIYRMAAASMGVETYLENNPLMPTADANWQPGGSGETLASDVFAKMSANVGANKYLFPIQASHSMRMMTPAKRQYFNQQNCF